MTAIQLILLLRQVDPNARVIDTGTVEPVIGLIVCDQVVMLATDMKASSSSRKADR